MKRIPLIAPSRSGHNWVCAMIRSWMPRTCQVDPYENAVPETFSKQYQAMIDSKACGELGPPILQVRDFLNWAASLIKLYTGEGESEKNAKQIHSHSGYWLAVAKEAGGHTSYFKDKHILIYDNFVESRAYRQELCRKIVGIYNESELGYVPNNGRFSSFDGRELQGRGYQMDVTHRYRWFMTPDGERFLGYVAENREAVEYYRDNFELTKEKKKLTEKLLKA